MGTLQNLQPEQSKTVPVEIDNQSIIKQGESTFLQTIFKAPPTVTTPVTKEWLEKQIEAIDRLMKESLEKQKAFNDKLTAQKESYLKLITEIK